MQLPEPVSGRTQLFSEAVDGLAVQLPGWRYPLVCRTDTGELRFDDYGGRWGDRTELDGFLQAYAVEKASIEARRNGHSIAEQQLDDGSIKLTVTIGGGA